MKNNKFLIVELIEDTNRFEWVPWIETHYKEALLYRTDEHKILFNGIEIKFLDFLMRSKCTVYNIYE